LYRQDSRIIYNNMTTENTYFANGVVSEQEAVTSQIYSVDFATGKHFATAKGFATDKDLAAHISADYLKVAQHYIGNSSNIGYLIKAGPLEGTSYTSPDATRKAFNAFNLANLRDPSWLPDGSKIVYQIPSWTQQAGELKLWSYADDWEYRYMDVFPTHNTVANRLATTQKVLGNANGSLITSSPLYTGLIDALDSYDIYSSDNATEVEWLEEGESGAFQPSWNPDGTEPVVGFGSWFEERAVVPAAIYRGAANGSFHTSPTDWVNNADFPSWSPDGTGVVLPAMEP
jgi:hypothetical protein